MSQKLLCLVVTCLFAVTFSFSQVPTGVDCDVDGPQINEYPSAFLICDKFYGTAYEYNFFFKNWDIVYGDMTNLVITYHLTQTDAESGTNPLEDPYITFDSFFTAYARVENIENQCFSVTNGFECMVEMVYYNHPTPLEICDENGDGFAEFDLRSKDEEITGGYNPSYGVAYYSDRLDAEANAPNALNSPYINEEVNEQIIYAQVTNYDIMDFECYEVVELTLVAKDCSLSSDLVSEINFKVAPNPASNVITITTKELDRAKIVIENIQGKVVLNTDLHFVNGSSQLNISQLESGLYFAVFESNNKRFVKKLFVK